jgi:hypothetical protein
MIQLKFYANRTGYYHNKLFTFNIKRKEEIGNILLPFVLNDNTFNAIFVKSLDSNYTYRLHLIEARQLVNTAALMRGIILVKH